jgi:D-alanyl-D-alanine carboxypeptidase
LLAPAEESFFLARMVLPRLLVAFPVLFTLGGAGGFGATARQSPTRPAAVDSASAYKGAIVVDAETGKVLFEDRADTVGAPASMTKLMTFAVVYDRLATGALNLDTAIRIQVSDARMGGTQVYLDPRETFTVEQLIYAMMIQSANDAAHALARFVGGSIPEFLELMNAKAIELGMTRTTFRTPHGLPAASRKLADGDLTTPRDFALLSRHLLLTTNATKYTSIRTRPFGEDTRKQAFGMTNHNHLIGKVAGVDGLKTGFTSSAGFCVAATAQRNGRRVIVVTMGSPDGKTRDLKVTELLERGFAALPPAPIAAKIPADSPLRPAPVSPAPLSAGTAEKPVSPAPVHAPVPSATSATEPPLIKFSLPKR